MPNILASALQGKRTAKTDKTETDSTRHYVGVSLPNNAIKELCKLCNVDYVDPANRGQGFYTEVARAAYSKLLA